MRRVGIFCLAAFLLLGARRVSAIHAVNPTDAEKLVQDVGAVLIDVRARDEFQQGHIPGAVSMPLNELSKRLKELPEDKTQPILVYCRNGSQSPSAAQLLLRSGRKDIYNLTGGLSAWVAAQKPIHIPQK